MRGIRWAISAGVLLLPCLAGAAPSVTLTAPAAGTRYVAPATIEVTANPAVDPGRTIARVEFLADGELVGIVTAAPWSFTLTNIARGNLNLRARVVDNLGRREASETVRVHVRNNKAPKVRVSAPEHRFIAPGIVPITATVTDRDDPIAKVEFFSGDTLLATSTAEPYAFDWLGLPVGDYEVHATATDILGAVGTSNPFKVRVRDNLAPRVRILGPENNATYPAPATIPISLRAVDRDDNLTNVVLLANGTEIASLATGPFDFTWTDIPAGTYALTAQATDELGLVTTSRTVNITVTGAPPAAEKKLYFIHVDHLNTPRLIADEMQRVVWRWEQGEPFGDSAPALGQFEFPMRFPGQYFDRETNLHYNTFRDYDPAIGGYVESDPVGLWGGMNTYAYVGSSPLRYLDSLGLMRWNVIWNGNALPGFNTQQQGCDVVGGPPLNLNRNACALQCCREHDDCYSGYLCNQSSWGATLLGRIPFLPAAMVLGRLPCPMCNANAVSCMMTAPLRDCSTC